MFIIFLYIIIFVVAIQGLFLFAGTTNRHKIDCILAFYLAFMVLEVGARFVLMHYFPEKTYISTGSPMGLTYGPALFLAYKLLLREPFRRSLLLVHLLPFLLGVLACVLYLSVPSFRASYANGYYMILHVGMSVSQLCYPMYVLVSKKTAPSLDLGIFKYTMVLMVILTSFTLPFAWTISDDGINDEPLLMGIVIVGCMLAYVCLAYWYMLGRYRDSVVPVREVNVALFPLEMSSEANESMLEAEEKQAKEIPSAYKMKIEAYLSLEKYYESSFKLEQMAEELAVPKAVISSYFTQAYPDGFVKTINAWRIEKACALLQAPDFSISMEELAFTCGFNSRASFYRNFNLEKGCSPTVYREAALSNA